VNSLSMKGITNHVIGTSHRYANVVCLPLFIQLVFDEEISLDNAVSILTT
jgi:hypothetical protein